MRNKTWVYILALIIVGSIISWGVPHFLGKTYANPHPNHQSYLIAVNEFENICGGDYSSEFEDNGIEYTTYYDNKGKAISTFMLLAHTFNDIYANGKFCHIYLSRNERVYRCCDKDRKVIAIRLKRHKGYFSMGEWEPAFYEINFYHDID
jgi:hypothetical protein